ncbi:cobalamin biosynthesis protein CobG [Streptomyces sp. VRA16 Mangrove soil]|uniref:cobalamin biosynthesis protein CobG n=1 Tax=Streptomyces sp. VRA16 Mangrove soil TaxID=2817434 RepID=UPI001E374560|nr:cobalamin biosynthesis protein CobG [Streptomyces sp. VRA16 Mangrove soil]
MSASPDPPISAGTGTSGDACPGALRLHAADDGFLARVRIPGGVLTADQARALGALSARLGDGALHLTSRGNVQLRGVRDGCGGALAEALAAAGLLPSPAHERVRNVVASPMSGLDGLGSVDVRGWLRALDAELCASAVTPGLSGRFLFALDDGRGDVAALGPDVLVRGLPGGDAEVSLGEARFRVAHGDAARAAVIAAEVFVTAAREAPGRTWRVAELTLSRAELEARLVSAGLRGEVADGPAAAATPAEPAGLALPFGTATPEKWAELTELAARLPAQELRLTPWRRVVVPGAPADPDTPWTRLGACIGSRGCAKAHTDVRADAAPRHPELPTYWSGCERRCGHPTGPYVDVTARTDGTYTTTTRTTHPS